MKITNDDDQGFRFQVSVFPAAASLQTGFPLRSNRFQFFLFFLTDTRNLTPGNWMTPDTLGFGAWDAVSVHHSPFTVFYRSASVSTENHCAALNWVIGAGFPEVETFTVKRVVD